MTSCDIEDCFCSDTVEDYNSISFKSCCAFGAFQLEFSVCCLLVNGMVGMLGLGVGTVTA